MEKQTLATIASTLASGDEPQITISTIALDRDKDEVVPEGGEFRNYLKNPVVGYGHFRNETIPVGVTTAIDVAPGRAIRARWRWLEGDAFAARVRNAFEQGVLRAASIGFLPHASEPNSNGGRRFTKWEMLEWSLVPLPANADAVRALKALDLWTSDEIVLELVDDEPTYTFEEVAAACAGLAHAARLRHSEPFEPVYDVAASEVRGMMRAIVAESLNGIVRQATANTIARLRGRVD